MICIHLHQVISLTQVRSFQACYAMLSPIAIWASWS